MNRIAAVGGATAVLFLLLGTTAPVYGQEDQGKGQKKQQGKPAQQPQQRVQQQQQQTRPTQQPQQRVQSNNSRPVTPSRNAASNRHSGGSSSAGGYSKAAVGRGKALGSRLAPNTGKSSIARGTSAAAMVATTFLKTVSFFILVANTGFASAAAPS